MFPYPSGDGLHVGHVRIYTAVDVMARYYRMKGYEVLDPIGWDAFGLPAENAAIKNKTNPQEIVPKNYSNFRSQMKNLQFSFDWDREFATTDPSYYGLTQWIFLELYKKGLIFREQVPINWCPKCMTGLANEEVLPDGTHERCGTPVSKKDLPQWVMRITDYADRLLTDLDVDLGIKEPKIDKDRTALDWPRGILEMQRNWIGKKEGVVIHHPVKGIDLTLNTFSAYPAWLWADTFLVIAPEHPLVNNLISGTKYESAVRAFVSESAEITNQQRVEDKFEKKGVFTGRYARDPFNNGREMPIWVANFALMDFGTGIIRCSAHDVRDYEFAKKYDIELNEVVDRLDPSVPINAHGNSGILKNSGPFTGKAIDSQLISDVVQWIVDQKIGDRMVNYHLRDWVFSRQRYWGEPIPLVYCAKCGDSNGVVPLKESDLPLELPYLESYEPTDTGESPLTRVTDWVNTICPSCGGPAKRETDTMPNWAGSCWYHLAFPFWKNSAGSVDEKTTPEILATYKQSGGATPFSDFWKDVARPAIDQWLPVDWYLGGAEHAVLHLLYARFWMKVLYDLGHIGFTEPYLRLRSVGIVLAEDGRKMSKSWGNVINPDTVVTEFGSDAVRLYEMFMGPWDQSIAWDSRALVGMKRFVERIEKVFADSSRFGTASSPILASHLARLIDHIDRGIVEQKFNTSIAAIMEFLNAWRNSDLVLSQEHAQIFAHILSPFAPATAQKVWTNAGGKGDPAAHPWPSLNAEHIDVPVTIAVQVNGKLRSTITVPSTSARDETYVHETALSDEKVSKWIGGQLQRVVFVPGRLINFIV